MEMVLEWSSAATSDASVSVHADADLTLDADNELKLQHGATDVVTIAAGGTAVEDDIISVTGTSSLGLTTDGTFVIMHGVGSLPTFKINAAGTKIVDDYVTVQASEAVLIKAVSSYAFASASSSFACCTRRSSRSATLTSAAIALRLDQNIQPSQMGMPTGHRTIMTRL